MLAVIANLALMTYGASMEMPKVTTANVRYGPQVKYVGYLAKPPGYGPFPGLVVIHEWWGINDNIKRESRKLAEAGYVALAVDLFGKSATNPQEATKMVQGLDQKAATAQLLAAAQYLRWRSDVKPDNVGSIGWCFGGAQSLNLALNDSKLAAAVIYYGRLVTDTKQLAKIHAAVLGVFGEDDQSIPMDQVRAFEKGLTEAKVANQVHTYPGAGHAFANPSGGERYRPEAAKDAWAKTMAFLKKHLE
jgi:carboxymethylenebutenolidase